MKVADAELTHYSQLSWMNWVRQGKQALIALVERQNLGIQWGCVEMMDRNGKPSYFRFVSLVRRAVAAKLYG